MMNRFALLVIILIAVAGSGLAIIVYKNATSPSRLQDGGYFDSNGIDPEVKTEVINLCASEAFPEKCYLKFAQDRKDASVCNLAAATHDQTVSISARSRCLLGVARATGDPAICPRLREEGEVEAYVRDSCYIEVAGYRKAEEFCKRVGNRPIPVEEDGERMTNRMFCYMVVAQARGEIVPCNNILEKEFRQQCYTEAAPLSNNESDCRAIDYATQQFDCYTRQAERRKDPAICSAIKEAVSNQPIKDVYVRNLQEAYFEDPYLKSRYTSNPQELEKSLQEAWESTVSMSFRKCYKEVAVAALDRAICDMIPVPSYNQTEKYDCYRYVKDAETKKTQP